MSKEETYTILVVGEGGVGKSALTIQLVESRFVTDYNPTIEDSFTKKLRVDGGLCCLKIIDTAGQEEYSALTEAHFHRANGFFVVFSVTERSGFDGVTKYRSRILSFFDASDFPLVIVGNKCDLTAQRVVSMKEGQDLVRSFGSQLTSFREASAKTNTNVEESFAELVRLIRRKRDGPASTVPLDNPGYWKKRRCAIF